MSESSAEGYGAYVQKVREVTQKYVQDLLTENERLRRFTASLESDISRLKEDKLRLHEKLLELREENDRFRQDQARLQHELSEIALENRSFTEQYAAVEEQNNNLANLYVASYRLCGSLDRHEILAAIQEIIINLVGSEELGIFELSPDGNELNLIGSFGLDRDRYRCLSTGSGVIGQAVRSGESWVSNGGATAAARPDEAGLTACIPLRLEGRVTGAIAIFRLLPQKGQLKDVDHEIFELLSTQAASSLYASALHEKLSETRSQGSEPALRPA